MPSLCYVNGFEDFLIANSTIYSLSIIYPHLLAVDAIVSMLHNFLSSFMNATFNCIKPVFKWKKLKKSVFNSLQKFFPENCGVNVLISCGIVGTSHKELVFSGLHVSEVAYYCHSLEHLKWYYCLRIRTFRLAQCWSFGLYCLIVGKK